MQTSYQQLTPFLQLVSTFEPILPVLHRLARGVLSLEDFQLHQGHGQWPRLPWSEHEHLMRAFFFRTHTDHFELVIHSQRRDCPLHSATNPERELQRALKI